MRSNSVRFNRLVMAVMVVAVGLTVTSARAGVTLDSLLGGGTLIVNDFKFDNFTYLKVGDMPDPVDIDVMGIQDVNGHWGIRFTADFKDLPGGGFSDALITYDVMALAEPITDAHLNAGTMIVGPGLLAVTETFIPGNPNAFLDVFEEDPGPDIMAAWIDFDSPQTVLNVQKDIFAEARGTQQGDVAKFTYVDQTFSIPEPANAMLLAAGFAMILRRKRTS